MKRRRPRSGAARPPPARPPAATHAQRVQRKDAAADFRRAEHDAVDEAERDGGAGEQRDLRGRLHERAVCAARRARAVRQRRVGARARRRQKVEQLGARKRQRKRQRHAEQRVQRHARGGGQREEPVPLVQQAQQAGAADGGRQREQRAAGGRGGTGAQPGTAWARRRRRPAQYRRRRRRPQRGNAALAPHAPAVRAAAKGHHAPRNDRRQRGEKEAKVDGKHGVDGDLDHGRVGRPANGHAKCRAARRRRRQARRGRPRRASAARSARRPRRARHARRRRRRRGRHGEQAAVKAGDAGEIRRRALSEREIAHALLETNVQDPRGLCRRTPSDVRVSRPFLPRARTRANTLATELRRHRQPEPSVGLWRR